MPINPQRTRKLYDRLVEVGSIDSTTSPYDGFHEYLNSGGSQDLFNRLLEKNRIPKETSFESFNSYLNQQDSAPESQEAVEERIDQIDQTPPDATDYSKITPLSSEVDKAKYQAHKKDQRNKELLSLENKELEDMTQEDILKSIDPTGYDAQTETLDIVSKPTKFNTWWKAAKNFMSKRLNMTAAPHEVLKDYGESVGDATAAPDVTQNTIKLNRLSTYSNLLEKKIDVLEESLDIPKEDLTNLKDIITSSDPTQLEDEQKEYFADLVEKVSATEEGRRYITLLSKERETINAAKQLRIDHKQAYLIEELHNKNTRDFEKGVDGTLYPAIRILNALAETPAALARDLIATGEMLVAGITDDEDITRSMMLDAYDGSNGNLGRRTSRELRPFSENISNVNFEGKTYEVGFDDNGNMTNIYDKSGNRAWDIESSQERIQEFVKTLNVQNPHHETEVKRHWQSTLNQGMNAATVVLGTMALGGATGAAARTLGAGTKIGALIGRSPALLEMMPTMAQFAGTYAHEAIRSGKLTDPDEILAYGLAGATAEMLTERLNPMIGKIAAGRPIFNVKDFKTLAGLSPATQFKRIAQMGLEFGKNIGSEILEEFIMEGATPLINNAFNKYGSSSFENEPITLNSLYEVALSTAFATAIPAGISLKHNQSDTFKEALVKGLKNKAYVDDIVSDQLKRAQDSGDADLVNQITTFQKVFESTNSRFEKYKNVPEWVGESLADKIFESEKESAKPETEARDKRVADLDYDINEIDNALRYRIFMRDPISKVISENEDYKILEEYFPQVRDSVNLREMAGRSFADTQTNTVNVNAYRNHTLMEIATLAKKEEKGKTIPNEEKLVKLDQVIEKIEKETGLVNLEKVRSQGVVFDSEIGRIVDTKLGEVSIDTMRQEDADILFKGLEEDVKLYQRREDFNLLKEDEKVRRAKIVLGKKREEVRKQIYGKEREHLKKIKQQHAEISKKFKSKDKVKYQDEEYEFKGLDGEHVVLSSAIGDRRVPIWDFDAEITQTDAIESEINPGDYNEVARLLSLKIQNSKKKFKAAESALIKQYANFTKKFMQDPNDPEILKLLSNVPPKVETYSSDDIPADDRQADKLAFRNREAEIDVEDSGETIIRKYREVTEELIEKSRSLLDPQNLKAGTGIKVEVLPDFDGVTYDPTKIGNEEIKWSDLKETLSKGPVKGFGDIEYTLNDLIPIRVVGTEAYIPTVHHVALLTDDRAQIDEIRETRRKILEGEKDLIVTERTLGAQFKAQGQMSLSLFPFVKLEARKLSEEEGGYSVMHMIGEEEDIRLNRGKLSEEEIDSLLSVFSIFFDLKDSGYYSESFKKHASSNGYDLTNFDSANDYVSALVPLFTGGPNGSNFLEVLKENVNARKGNFGLEFDRGTGTYSDQFIISTAISYGQDASDPSNVNIGDKATLIFNSVTGKKEYHVARFEPGKDKPFSSRPKGIEITDTDQKNFANRIKLVLSQSHYSTLRDQDKIKGKVRIPSKSGGFLFEGTADEFLRSKLTTNIIPINVGTQDSPRSVFRIQPGIRFGFAKKETIPSEPVTEEKKVVPKTTLKPPRTINTRGLGNGNVTGDEVDLLPIEKLNNPIPNFTIPGISENTLNNVARGFAYYVNEAILDLSEARNEDGSPIEYELDDVINDRIETFFKSKEVQTDIEESREWVESDAVEEDKINPRRWLKTIDLLQTYSEVLKNRVGYIFSKGYSLATEEELDTDKLFNDTADDRALVYDIKKSASEALQLYLYFIPKGTQILNYLDEFYSIDNIWHRVKNILAINENQYIKPSWEAYKGKLLSDPNSFDFIKPLVDKLDKAPEHIQIEFVTIMRQMQPKMYLTKLRHSSTVAGDSVQVDFINIADLNNAATTLNEWRAQFAMNEDIFGSVRDRDDETEGLVINKGILDPVLEHIVSAKSAFNTLNKIRAKRAEGDEKEVLNTLIEEVKAAFDFVGITLSKATYNQIKNFAGTNEGPELFSKFFDSKGLFGIFSTDMKRLSNKASHPEVELRTLSARDLFTDNFYTNLAKHDNSLSGKPFSDSNLSGNKIIQSSQLVRNYGERFYRLINSLKGDNTYADEFRNRVYSKFAYWLRFTGDRNNKMSLEQPPLEIMRDDKTNDTDMANLGIVDRDIYKLLIFKRRTESMRNPNSRAFVSSTMESKKNSLILIAPGFKISKNESGIKQVTSEGFTMPLNEFLFQQLVLPEILRMINHVSLNNATYNPSLFYNIPELNGKYSLDQWRGMLNYESLSENEGRDYSFNPVDSTMWQEVLSIVEKHADKVTDDQIKSWEKKHLYDPEHLDPKISGVNYFPISKWENPKEEDLAKRIPYTPEQLLDLKKKYTEEYALNYLVFHANESMLILGDPAMYYKKPKKNDNAINSTFKNRLKRLAQFNASLIPQIEEKENEVYLQGMLNREEEISSIIDEIVQILDNKKYDPTKGKEEYPNSTKWFEVDGSDGQEFASAQFYLNFIRKLGGRISRKDYDRYSRMFKKQSWYADRGKKIPEKYMLSPKELAFFLNPLKTLHSGFETENNVEYNILLKSSVFPLIPQVTRGFKIDGVRRAMEAGVNGTPIGKVAYDTAWKLGAPLKGADHNNPVFDVTNTKFLSNSGLGLQQETPVKAKNKVPHGTQQTKIKFADLLDAKFKYRGEEITGKQLKEKHDEKYSKLFELHYNKFRDEHTITKIVNGRQHRILDYERLRETIIKEMIARDYSMLDQYSVQLNEDKTGFKYPLWTLPSFNRIDALLSSIIEDRVLKQKFNGRPHILVSSQLFTPIEEIDGAIDVSKLGITVTSGFSGSLKSRRKANGDLLFAQVMVPWRFKEDINLFMKDGIIDPKKLPRRLLKGLGFRIPTSGLNSLQAIEIVGFLPPAMGDVILAPSDFTKQMGSDFDVDKLYTHLRNVRVIGDQFYDVLELSQPRIGETNYSDFPVEKPKALAQREYTPENITSLKPNEVFVFGSNPLGINGNPDKWPNMSASRATANGWVKQGEIMDNRLSNSGKAWGITTVTKPGAKLSRTPEQIGKGIQDMLIYAKAHPELRFLVTKFGTENAGYSVDVIRGLFEKLREFIPNNVILPIEYEVRKSPSIPSRTIAIVGTAGRSQVPTLDEWNNMLSDAESRVSSEDVLISGGAAFADHIAVKLFLEGKVKGLKLRLPAKISNGEFVGERGTAGGTANYYHDKFGEVIGVDTIAEIEEAIRKGAEVTYETEVSNKAMFIRNAKVAKESTAMIAYTYGEGNEPADGGTKDTWDKSKYLDKVHVSISKIGIKEENKGLAQRKYTSEDIALEIDRLQNDIMDINQTLFESTDPIVEKKIYQPLGYGILEDEANERADKGVTSYLSTETQGDYYSDARGAKGGVGSFSLDLVFNSIIQGTKLEYQTPSNDEYDLVLYNMWKEKLSDGTNRFKTIRSYEDKNGQTRWIIRLDDPYVRDKSKFKSEILSAFQNVSVDDGNLQIMKKLGITPESFSVIRTMIYLGYKESEILATLKSHTRFFEEVSLRSNQFAKQGALKIYGNVFNTMIEEFQAKASTQEEKDSLSRIKFFNEMGDNIRNLQTDLNLDAKGFSASMINLVERQDAYVNMINKKAYKGFFNVRRVLLNGDKNTYVGAAMKYGTGAGELFFNYDLIPYGLDTVKEVMKEVYENVDQKFRNNTSTATDTKETIFSALKTFALEGVIKHVFGESLDDVRYQLTKGGKEYKDSVKYPVITLKLKRAKKAAPNNYFLSMLKPERLKDGKQNIYLIKTLNTKAAVFDDMSIVTSVLELYNNPVQIEEGYTTRDFLIDLYRYSYAINPIQGPNEFMKYLHPAFMFAMPEYREYVKKALWNVTETPINVNNFTLQFFQNHPEYAQLISTKEFKEFFTVEKVNFLGQDVPTLKVKEGVPFQSTAMFLRVRGSSFGFNAVFSLYMWDQRIKRYVKVPEVGNYLYKKYNPDAGLIDFQWLDSDVLVEEVESTERNNLDFASFLSNVASKNSLAQVYKDLLDRLGITISEFSVDPTIDAEGKHRKISSKKSKIILRALDEYSLIHELGHAVHGRLIDAFLYRKGEYNNERLLKRTDGDQNATDYIKELAQTLTPQQLETLENIEEIRKKYAEAIKTDSTKYRHGLDSLHEFFNFVIQDEGFRSLLDEQEKGVVQQIIDFISKVFADFIGVPSQRIRDEMLKIIDSHVDNIRIIDDIRDREFKSLMDTPEFNGAGFNPSIENFDDPNDFDVPTGTPTGPAVDLLPLEQETSTERANFELDNQFNDPDEVDQYYNDCK